MWITESSPQEKITKLKCNIEMYLGLGEQCFKVVYRSQKNMGLKLST